MSTRREAIVWRHHLQLTLERMQLVKIGRHLGAAAVAAIGFAPAVHAQSSGDSITWTNRIASLARERCERCHCVGGAAPFPLSSVDDFAGAAPMIRETVGAGIMPPWVATEASGPFKFNLSLRPEEKRDLLRWLEAGCPVGEPAPPLPPYVAPSGWVIGEPDLVVTSPEAVAIPATGVVDYMTLDAPTGLDHSVWVQAVQIRCEHPTVCHHIGARAIYPGKPGQEFVAFYLPGSGPTLLPDGYAIELRPGATIRFDFHYTPDGTATTERTSIGFKFAKEPPQQRVMGRIMSRNGVPISIPPGVENHVVEYEYRFPYSTQVRRLIPHMHLRGKSMKVEIVAPDGTVTTPLELKRWHPDWQFVYEFETPLVVEKGTTIRCTHLFDNSKKNPFNPDPTAHVRAGPQIWEEMACIYVETMSPADQPPPRWSDSDAPRRRRPGKPASGDDSADGSDSANGGG